MVSSEGACAAYYQYEHRKSHAGFDSGLKDLRHERPPLPKIRFRDAQIEMAHGAGGKASRRLIEGLFAPILFGASTEPLGDAAHIGLNGTRLAITADSFVVSPLRFPGGSIGELAVNGTVNDLAVSGARAEALVVTYVLEAGLPTEVLEAEVRAMAAAARAAGVTIAGGDTKVVEHGKADGMYITTAGIGRLIPGVQCLGAFRPPRRRHPAFGPDRRSRHHHPAGARRTGPGSRSLLRHPPRAPVGGGAGALPPRPDCAGCAIPPAAASPPR